MEIKTNKPRKKPLFCFDINIEFLELKKNSNKHARFIPTTQLKGNVIRDQDIILQANKENVHLITHNTDDFRQPYQKIKIGIICVGLKDEDVWISKINKLFSKFPNHSNYYWKTILISNSSIQIKDRKTGEVYSVD